MPSRIKGGTAAERRMTMRESNIAMVRRLAFPINRLLPQHALAPQDVVVVLSKAVGLVAGGLH